MPGTREWRRTIGASLRPNDEQRLRAGRRDGPPATLAFDSRPLLNDREERPNAMKTTLRLVLLMSLLAGFGCAKKEGAAAPADDHAGHGHSSGHAHQPLMGGMLVELGEHQFNLELKYDPVRGVLQAWVLDGHAENFVRVSMGLFDIQEAGGAQRTITLRAVGNPMTGEKPGDTSAFEGEARWLGDVAHFDGIVKALKVRDLEFRGIEFHLHPKG